MMLLAAYLQMVNLTKPLRKNTRTVIRVDRRRSFFGHEFRPFHRSI